MFHLVTGGSGSGKSEYAENFLVDIKKKENRREPFIYVATMQPFGEEAYSRIAKHRNMRKGKGFKTVECYRNLHDLVVDDNKGVLLECMSNLVANECFPEHRTALDIDAVYRRVIYGVRRLSLQTENLVIVTNEIASDHVFYDYETELYREVLGKINCELARMADLVTEVVYGIPICIKEANKS